jgi:hypothetical protein
MAGFVIALESVCSYPGVAQAHCASDLSDGEFLQSAPTAHHLAKAPPAPMVRLVFPVVAGKRMLER